MEAEKVAFSQSLILSFSQFLLTERAIKRGRIALL
jgi:hypothetical protein